MRPRNRYRYVSADPPEGVVMRDPEMRASQEERERVVDLLRTHAGEGRLELDELEERVEAALGARTRGDLAALVADLPGSAPSRRGGGVVRTVALGSLAAAFLPLFAGIAILALAPSGFRLDRLDGDRLVVLRRPALGGSRLRVVRPRQAAAARRTVVVCG